jgi:glyoxylase-like metal-dependent hydrolase (beta-lactamase superfamily II)/rhodanese-related sulfurtransferase
MYFEQFYLGCLAHASYMAGSDGEVAVIDPQRDVEIYLEEARKHGLKIAHVIETHLHADFVSGHQELAARTGARIYLGARAGATFEHVPVKDGEEIRFGRCVLRFLETPGHTLESISILVTDLDRSPEPFAVLTGDTLFIGDVGRPDLARDHTPQQLAGLLFESLHGKLLKLGDDVAVYPAHGAGSLCGRQISSEKSSTVAKERATNYALQVRDKERFINLVTSELPPRPEYFERDVELNRTGAAPLAALPPLPAMDAGEVDRRMKAGTLVLDTRPTAQFGAGHVPGSVHVGLTGQFASWVGRILGLEKPLMLVAEDPEAVEESRVRLARVGIERVIGYLDGGIAGWIQYGRPLDHIPQVAVHELARSEDAIVLDVRNPGEWNSGHIPEAVHIPLDLLEKRMQELDRTRPILVHCKGGYRSSIATSLLKRNGFDQVINVTGGFDAWQAAGLPVTAAA